MDAFKSIPYLYTKNNPFEKIEKQETHLLLSLYGEIGTSLISGGDVVSSHHKVLMK